MRNGVLGAAIVLKMLITYMYNENDEVSWSKENEWLASRGKKEWFFIGHTILVLNLCTRNLHYVTNQLTPIIMSPQLINAVCESVCVRVSLMQALSPVTKFWTRGSEGG